MQIRKLDDAQTIQISRQTGQNQTQPVYIRHAQGLLDGRGAHQQRDDQQARGPLPAGEGRAWQLRQKSARQPERQQHSVTQRA
ncbi:hypothetical protein, partial [uncultured Desulfovibrio sp.]|uniref:hypothetical protein n=1 Tax=uncultured Desulfovibrio sp. TaxID=167968 RepID=UPI00272A445D